MRTLLYRTPRLLVFTAVIFTSAATASAQTCLGIDACLLSPARVDAGRPVGFNGCSVPSEAGLLGQFWGTVFETACNQHDTDWGTFKPDIAAWFAQSNSAFRTNMLAICAARPDLPAAACTEAANIFFLAVSTTSIAADIYKRAQYFASSCACRQLPSPPTNLTADVSAGSGGAQVSLQWAAGSDATSYQVEVVQPFLAPIDTNSRLPMFSATGVPNGVYRVQVRAANPLGASAPSNIVDVVVGSSTPCVAPGAPTGVAASFNNGTATMNWSAVAGATSYVVRAGLIPSGSELFNGNVGNTTSVGASGLPAGFRAFGRVYALNACGTSGPSAEVIIGG